MTKPQDADGPGDDTDDQAVERAHDGATFDADEGDPDGAAFAGADTATPADEKPREHGYGYE